MRVKKSDAQIYAAIFCAQKVDEGYGIEPAILQLNVNAHAGLKITGEMLEDYVKKGVFAYKETEGKNRLFLSLGAEEYLLPKNLGRAWEMFPEIRGIAKDGAEAQAKRIRKDNTQLLRTMDDPVARLLLNPAATYSEEMLNRYHKNYIFTKAVEPLGRTQTVTTRKGKERRRYFHIHRGENFWQAAAELLRKHGITSADIRLTKGELEELERYLPEFNKKQDTAICLVGLDRAACEEIWKESPYIQYSKQRDIEGAKLFLSRYAPEVVVKPKEAIKLHLTPDEFIDVCELLHEEKFAHQKRRGTLKELEWYNYITLDKEGLWIDVPAYIEDKAKHGAEVKVGEIKIPLIKDRIFRFCQEVWERAKEQVPADAESQAP